MTAKRLRVEKVHSTIGRDRRQEAILRGLGIRRMHQAVVVPNTPSFRGMIRKVIHLVRVEECDE